MNQTLVARFFTSVLLLTGCWIAYTQNQGKQPPALTLNKVKDDLYEIEGDGGNVAVYVTGEGVVLVDDKFEQDHEGIIAKVKSVTDQRSEEHTSELQSRGHLVCRLLLEKKKS